MSPIIGTILSLLVILVGNWLAGGQAGQIVQGVALLIVSGGLFGALLLSYPWDELKSAFSLIGFIYGAGDRGSVVEARAVVGEIVLVATVARKDGVLALEALKSQVRDPLVKASLQYMIDGLDANDVAEILNARVAALSRPLEDAARIFETAGSYAPAIGIIGAVLGLIQVMTMLSDPTKIGEGIAVSFVSALYGLMLANLVLLPWSAKLRRGAVRKALPAEIARAGIAAILSGLSPNVIKEKLEAQL